MAAAAETPAGCAEGNCAVDTMLCACGEVLAFCRDHLGKNGWAPDLAGCWRHGKFDEIVTRLGWDCESSEAAGTMVRHRLGEISTVLTEDGPEFTVVWYDRGCGPSYSDNCLMSDAVAALPGYLAGESVTSYHLHSNEPNRHTNKFKPKPRATKAARA